MRKLGEIGERKLVDWIVRRLGELDGATLPPGDDAVDFFFRGRMIASCDMLVEETDVPKGMKLRNVGYKAVTAATSDIAAKGGKPLAYLISLIVPSDMSEESFKDLWIGFEEAAELYGGKIIGGDLNSGNQIVVDVAVMGRAEKTISRVGARPGDIVAVTGRFGAHAAGLHALLNNNRGDEVSEEAIEKFERPVARIGEAIAMSESGAVTSSIDSSDGLAESLYLLSEANDLGFVIEEPPVSEIAARYSEKFGADLFDLVFYGGEEYELVVTVKANMLEDAVKAVERAGGELIPIGKATERKEIKVLWNDEERIIERKGYQHFKSNAI